MLLLCFHSSSTLCQLSLSLAIPISLIQQAPIEELHDPAGPGQAASGFPLESLPPDGTAATFRQLKRLCKEGSVLVATG